LENNNQQQHRHLSRSEYREYEKKRHAERRKRWRRKRAINYLINGSLIAAAVGLVFLFDFLVSLQDSTPAETPTKVVEQQTPDTSEEDMAQASFMVALPEKSYAFAGEPITYQFLNLTGYNSLENIRFEVNTGGKGKVYEDRWEYTPKKAETVTFEFKAFNKNDKKICEGKTVIEVKEKSEKKSLTLLVIGDSTIEAGYETEKLLALAKEDGYSLKLLGTQTAPYLKDSDNRYEGYGGWSADHYINKRVVGDSLNPFYNPTTRTFDFTYYMENQWYTSVDCVCIQLGINDVFSATSDNELMKNYIPLYLKQMDRIIENIHQYDPNIKVVWNLVSPGSVNQEKFAIYSTMQTAERYKRNSFLANLEIIKHVAELKNVYVAPTNAALDTVKDMAGSGHGAVHPAIRGYQDIATLLYGFIRAIN